ncbi:hypothetical protein HGB07_06485 [Candidatus Roizmanbacteria bacterium]|nr:hypothetical protein [Candidatus Roizmanbacteria bacterium]
MNNSIFKHKQVFVISPHLDDALLSMGTFLSQIKEEAEITVVSIFTKGAPAPYTLSARKFISDSGCTDAVTLFRKRIQEDQKALALIRAKHIYLGIPDALFRKKEKSNWLGKILPEFNHLYPTYRFHIMKGEMAAADDVVYQIKKELKKRIPPHAIVISPFGIGEHVDHVITRMVCEELFSKVVYYVDFPYSLRHNDFGQHPEDYRAMSTPADIEEKQLMVNCYASQVNGLFPGGIVPAHKEVLFVPDKI